MNKIKFNIISLLLAPIPFLFVSLLVSLFNSSLYETKFVMTINTIIIYLAELTIALPLLLFMKKNYNYKHTVLFGVFIGLFSAFIFTLRIWNNGLIDLLLTHLRTYLAGIIVGFLISSCFWIINNFLNKCSKQHVD